MMKQVPLWTLLLLLTFSLYAEDADNIFLESSDDTASVVEDDNIFLESSGNTTAVTDDDNIFFSDDDSDSALLDDIVEFSDDEIDESPIDWKIDISASGVVPFYNIGEGTINLESKSSSSFAFDVGINLITLKKYLFASVSARYLNLSFDVNRIESKTTTPIDGTTLTDIYSTEEVHYFSVPVAIGARKQFGAFTPYLFFELEPAILTGASLHSKTIQKTSFENGAMLTKEYIADRDVADYRKTKQLFYGFGGGLEFNYGYGVVYLESAYKMTYFDHDYSNDPVTNPVRINCDLAYVPITVGLRFYF